MTDVTLHIDKTLEQNAALYFEKAKKSKKKLAGVLAVLERSLKKLGEIESKQAAEALKPVVEKKVRKREWYEKFRWFFSSEGFLVIGGRDATTNDIVVKKHASPGDLVFHTDMAGSPFFIVKAEGREIGDDTIEEVAQATASYNSHAWANGLSTIDVFYVNPDQVTKTANTGEFLGKGSFMIRGKTTYVHPTLGLAIGVKDGVIIGGPVDAVKKNADQFVVIVQGKDKASDIAKKIKAKFKVDVELDDIIRFLPAGGCQIKK
ncbi:MAG: NFACT RNA binding domain-containing protein [Candidatus Woesearchaeota archaeon]